MGDCRELVQWLLENGGPAIRYRAATELMDDVQGIDLERLAEDLVQSRMVQLWMDRFAPLRPGDGPELPRHTHMASRTCPRSSGWSGKR